MTKGCSTVPPSESSDPDFGKTGNLITKTAQRLRPLESRYPPVASPSQYITVRLAVPGGTGPGPGYPGLDRTGQ
eukprot:166619-Hanusia_phi.AAC.1